jgi:Tfp pilus assembly protein FimT
MSRAQDFSASSGFAIYELLIVIFLIGMMAAVAAPWFTKLHHRNVLRTAAVEIETTLLAARMRAVKRNLPASVFINTTPDETGSYRLDTIEPDPPAPAPTPTPIRHLLISSKSLRFVSLPDTPKITFDGSGRRTFPPSPTPGTIVVEGLDSNQITVETDVSGRVRIITPVEWK